MTFIQANITLSRAVERGGGYPGLLPQGPGQKGARTQNVTNLQVLQDMKTNRRLTEKRLRAYGFLQPAFINGKILEPTTDLNGFSLMKRK